MAWLIPSAYISDALSWASDSLPGKLSMLPRPHHSSKKLLAALVLVLLATLTACQQSETALPTDLPTAIPSPTLPSPTALPTATATSQPTQPAPATPEPSPTQTSHSLPASARITGISGHRQTYELGCETSAAVDWAGYFGVLIYESTFQFDLPLSDNPDLGFVGNVTTDAWGQIPPYAYGVHAEPIAELLRQYGLPAKAVRGMTLEEAKAELAEGDPIIAWVIGNMEYSEPVRILDKAGNPVTVAPFEHVVILIGYDEVSIAYMNNGKFFSVPIEVFLTSWGVLGNMAVIHD